MRSGCEGCVRDVRCGGLWRSIRCWSNGDAALQLELRRDSSVGLLHAGSRDQPLHGRAAFAASAHGRARSYGFARARRHRPAMRT
jgi:hypothetical protein